jgi:DNA-directed RNA polymerase specialized sigma24 family protein
VVHDAFCGLCRRWSKLTDPARAAAYLRAAVLNGCRDALRRLPGRQREVLVLRYYLELPDAEVSRVMGIGESSVRSAAHRGLAALARLLTGETS